MNILGIDTILHDVCVSIISNGVVKSNVIHHLNVPQSRKDLLYFTFSHVEIIGKILKGAFVEAKIKQNEINLISVTNEGSLLSNVIIGVTVANTIGQMNNIPIIGVKHDEAHLFSNWIERDEKKFEYPILVFSASGGHTSLTLIKNKRLECEEIFNARGIKSSKTIKPEFIGLGTISSDVILRLNLGKSKKRKNNDGLLLSELAEKGNGKFNFYKDYKNDNENFLDFNKIRKYILKCIDDLIIKNKYGMSKKLIYDISASYEKFISDLIMKKIILLAKRKNVRHLHLAGGMSANSCLRQAIKKESDKCGFKLLYPLKLSYCVDNAAMTANLGYLRYKLNKKNAQPYISVKSDLLLEKIAVNQRMCKSKN